MVTERGWPDPLPFMLSLSLSSCSPCNRFLGLSDGPKRNRSSIWWYPNRRKHL
ncbi:hypothetical protein Hanom_Chr08g00699261 [Helianthus anomalus]